MNHSNSAEIRLPADGIAISRSSSRTRVYAGRALGGLAIAFLLFDTALKVLMVPAAVEGTTQLGYPKSVVLAIGVIEVLCLVAYAIPRTSVFGAILWAGYLGGAVATHVRVGSPLITHTLFPMCVAVLLWAGLWLRDHRLRTLLPVLSD
jgi:hypothetical protein